MSDSSHPWYPFFRGGTPVMAVPSWSRPRLFAAAGSVRARWRGSAAYPAYRLTARLARHVVRLWAASGLGLSVRRAPGDGWSLARVLEDTELESEIGRLRTASVLVGTPGPAQKLIAELRDETGTARAYFKFGTSEISRERLCREYRVLCAIPDGVGPAPLRLAEWTTGTGLLTTALEGSPLPGSLPPPRDLTDLLPENGEAQLRSAGRHPELQRLLDRGAREEWIDPLLGRDWPVVVRHGDFAPWNLHRGSDGRLRALDWEYGSLDGFPHLDLAHYVLQVGTLVYDWSPERAFRRSAGLLADPGWTDLDRAPAETLTRLAAFDAHEKSASDGHDPDEPLQRWRRALWNQASPTAPTRGASAPAKPRT